MPGMKRDRDGNVVDSRSVIIGGSKRPVVDGSREGGVPRPGGVPYERGIEERTDFVEDHPPEHRGGDDAGRFGAVTEPVGERPRAPGAPTELYIPGSPAPGGRGDASSGGRTGPVCDDPMADPPVGWLIAVQGPGRGRVATLGIGANSIGRDSAERVPLDYGDQKISRRNHGVITYDPRGRKFYVQPGSGQNLTYVNDEPVLAPRELEPLTHVQLGDTVLRFVPLCGAGFSWDDESDGE